MKETTIQATKTIQGVLIEALFSHPQAAGLTIRDAEEISRRAAVKLNRLGYNLKRFSK
jgi:hypothetical protein